MAPKKKNKRKKAGAEHHAGEFICELRPLSELLATIARSVQTTEGDCLEVGFYNDDINLYLNGEKIGHYEPNLGTLNLIHQTNIYL